MKTKIDFTELNSETLRKIWDSNEKFRTEIRSMYRDNLLYDINEYMNTLIKGGGCYWELDAWDNCIITVEDAHKFAVDCMAMVDTFGTIDGYEAKKLALIVRADELIYYDDMFNDDEDIISEMIEEQVKKVRELIESAIEDELQIVYNDVVVFDWYEEVWCNEIYDITQEDYYIDDNYVLYKMVEKCYK